MLSKKWKFKGTGKDRFVFLHIPKTAGTTFRYMIYNHFDDDKLYPTVKDLKKNNHGYLNQNILKEKHKEVFDKEFVIGHFNIHVVQMMPKDVKILTFLRNPVNRTLSHLKHLKKNNPKYKNLDINEVVRLEINNIYHVQALCLGFNQNKPNYAELEKYINRVDFIGMTDYFDESISLCNKMFDWKLEHIKPMNKIDGNVLRELDSKSMSMICRRLIPDITAYNLAFRKFSRLCKSNEIELKQ